MERGISFKVEGNREKLLKLIFDSIDVTKYNWYSISNQNEAWTFNERGTEKFLDDIYYQGEDFLREIEVNHLVVFLKLEAYTKKTNKYNIHMYEEFQNNDCKILLLIYDCKYIEIYVKDDYVKGKIYENAIRKGFYEVEYITDFNDTRQYMDIL